MCKTTVDEWDRWRNPYQMMYETTVHGWEKWRTTHTRWCMKQLLKDERDEGIHARWCTKQLLMDETSEGLPIPDGAQNNCWWAREMKESIPDGVRNNCWWMRPMKNYPHPMRYKTTVDGWDRCRKPYQMGTKQLLMDETNEGLPISDEVQNNFLWMRQMKKSIPDGVRNNCLWMRPMNDYPYQIMYKTTADGWGRWRNPHQMMCKRTAGGWGIWRNPYQMMGGTIVDGWDQWRTSHTRWCTSQTTVDGWNLRTTTQARWCPKELLMDDINKGSIPDDVGKNCWWNRPTKGYPGKMVHKTIADGWKKLRHPYQKTHETTVDG